MAAASLVLRAVRVLRARLAGPVLRGVHGSPAACGKNLLKKFAAKNRKKFWYDAPSLGPHLAYKPSQVDVLTKNTARRAQKEDHVRLRALNGLLYKALTDLLCTPHVSQEVSLTSDFSACRVYWRTSLSAEWNARAQAELQRSAAHMRHLLMSLQILRNVPPLVFVQDREKAALAEVDRLLAVADFGPLEEDKGTLVRDSRPTKAPLPCALPPPTASWSLCGIDHEALNQQIMEYKKKEGQGAVGRSPPGQEQLAVLTRQMSSRRKKARARRDADLSPKSALWEVEDEGDPEEDLEEPGLGYEEELDGCGWADPEAEAEASGHSGRNRGD
ncbi:putative ribosome-binding factor A, mitochondrial isoform X2 [Erinaceus europaeus]|uniref:Ribosome-binding factor A, mitochondrial isoform X2 n=1 Tax=Erinaceus europaeus TaxID=9365 RepID=A0ABM3W0E6_ERIEU|nr:putative ribosome-binding factor A, mitochondrial isoform X2 [Erinaceus europaeus]